MLKWLRFQTLRPKGRAGLAPLHLAVELAVEVLVPFQPEALPDQHLGVRHQDAQELDEGAVVELLAGLGRLHELVHRDHAAAAGLDVDAARLRLGPRGEGEVAGRLALHHLVERAVALVAPHQAVDVVVPDLVLDDRVDPGAVVGVRGRRLVLVAAIDVDLQALGEVRDLDRSWPSRGRRI